MSSAAAFAELLALWVCANYLAVPASRVATRWEEIIRVALCLVGPAFVLGPGRWSFGLGALAALLSSARHAAARCATSPQGSGPGWEIGGTGLYLVASGLAATRAPLQPWLDLPLPVESVETGAIMIAALVFLGEGASRIVRGLLDKAGTLPARHRTPSFAAESGDAGDGVDVAEVRRGRLIGFLERWLVFVLVLAGSYGAVGFVVAAKGIVRAKEFEDRDFAEYFLIGTFASLIIALVVSLGVKRLLALP